MLNKVRNYVEKYHMLSKGDTVAVGVSGGADSVCLLFALSKLQPEYDLRLLVVHVNHKIRPEAKQDSDYVKQLCDKWNLPFFLFEKDVQDLAREWGLSTEEAGRKIRYECFEEVLRGQAKEAVANGTAKVAVAHNVNDRAETMLFNLFRGSGLKGLGSIKPVRGHVIRPLLCLERAEIEAILKQEGLAFQEDWTNKEDLYSRNKIRNHVLPYVEREISAGATSHIATAAQLLALSQDYLGETVDAVFEKYVVREEDGKFSVFCPDMKALHPYLRSEVILRMFEQMVPYRKDLGMVHVELIEQLVMQEGNRQIDLPYGMTAKRTYDVVSLQKGLGQGADEALLEKEKRQFILGAMYPQRVEIEGMGILDFQLFPYEKNQEIPQNQYTKWFDYDKIKNYITVRNRMTGDYLTINAQLGKKSLQDYMIDLKIPKEMRDQVWLLADDQHVIWVLGYRISQEYKVSENTKRILQVQLLGGK